MPHAKVALNSHSENLPIIKFGKKTHRDVAFFSNLSFRMKLLWLLCNGRNKVVKTAEEDIKGESVDRYIVGISVISND